MTAQIIVDLRTGKLTNDAHQGVTGFISWKRLTESLRETGEITDREDVVVIEATELGLRFIVTERKSGA